MAEKSFEPGAPVGQGEIPLCVPEIRGNEWIYLKETLDTNFVSSVGPFVDRFERDLARISGARSAVAVGSGTAALHLSLLVAGVQPGDEVLVSTLTFIAPVNSIRYVGAFPVLMDADPLYWQMDPQKVSDFLTKECDWRNGSLVNRSSGRQVRAIMPVHVLGHPVDLDPIMELARKFNLIVIEDATESLGAEYKGQVLGPLGDIGCFSFNGNKLITTGGGGMIVTNNAAWGKRAKYLSTQAKDDPVEFVHGAIGYNYRLSNIAAAMGCAQLEQLDSYIQAKRNIADRYVEGLSGVPGISFMQEAEWAFSIYWMYTIMIDQSQYGMDSRALLKCLAEAHIQTRPLWQPIHRSPAHRDAQAYRCEVADQLHRDALSLPCSVGLTEVDQQKVIDTIRSARS